MSIATEADGEVIVDWQNWDNVLFCGDVGFDVEVTVKWQIGIAARHNVSLRRG